MLIQSINPYNNQLIGEYEELSERDLEVAIGKSDRAFLRWRQTPFSERAKLMLNCAELLDEKVEFLAEVITREMGKIKRESIAEIKKCAWVCRYYAENSDTFLKDEMLPVTEAESYITYDPLGIVLAIMPWNFPFWQVFRFAAPNIMAGNVGLLKHASNVPQCALEIEKIFLEADFPEYVFQSLLIKSDKVSKVIDDPRIKAVTLTGSDATGRKVAERAGKNIKKLVLELGGSDPFIVLADADLDSAIKTGVKARMINCGQSCIAAKRFILDKKIANDYLEGYLKYFQQLSLGDPWDEITDVGPMARDDLRKELDDQVKKSVSYGAKIIYGGNTSDLSGFFYMPTILENVRQGMPAFDEELFGPVAPFIVVDDVNEAIRMANNSLFGLGASLWTRDIEQARIWARQIESGSVFVNSMVASHPMVPFGGIKCSGYGRELSHLGIREFMNIKSVWINK